MATVFTIKLTHITTGVEKVIPITQRDFMNFVTCREREYLQVELLKEKEEENIDKLLSDIMQRTDIGEDWFDHYKLDGIFVGTMDLKLVTN